jgi:hypothetical protein
MTTNVFKKLQEARVRLAAAPLKKSGDNKFVGFKYFELGDFLPTITTIFKDLGLCDIVTFSADVAALQIFDSDNPESSVVFTSPMGSSNLKGCHEVQNIGATETYQRRYLYVNALDIVEHDALDSSMTKDEAPPTKKSIQKPVEPSKAANTAAKIDDLVSSGGVEEALRIYTQESANLEDKTRLWGALSTETKNAFHKHKKGES